MTRWLPPSLILAGAVLIGCTPNAPAKNAMEEKKESQNDAKGKPEQKPADPNADFKITAEALAKEFVADLKVADQKFKGKTVEITGIIEVVSHNTIHMNGMVKGTAILCDLLPEYFEKGMRGCSGQKVKLIGEYELAGDSFVAIKNCRYYELEPSKVLLASAESVAKEFESDLKAARAKYHEANIIVSGVVEDLYLGKETIVDGVTVVDSAFVKLKGTEKTRVNIPVIYDKQKLKGIKKGESVEMRIEVYRVREPMLVNNEVQFSHGFLLGSKKNKE